MDASDRTLKTQVPLTAEVNGSDWASLVRKEAVRLQQSFNMHAVEQATTLRLPCTAYWDTQAWSVSFDQVNWVVVRYDEVPSMTRPSYTELEEFLTWQIASAGEQVVNKKESQMRLPTAITSLGWLCPKLNWATSIDESLIWRFFSVVGTSLAMYLANRLSRTASIT